MARIKGHRPLVGISRARPLSLEDKVRNVMLDRTVVDVKVQGDQLYIELDDGGNISLSCDGGFLETG